MELKLALKVNDLDNVATIFASGVSANAAVDLRDKKGKSEKLTVLSDIPYGHKVALRDIHLNEAVIKYGEELGAATKEIRRGEHVHAHNLDSRRGRGDLEPKK
ncbi:MAG: UxaA family hydrolase [Deltaproteobacteria bacterium]|nr:UxaA family hydrolase [Deltaproteobacteria bacterium]